MDLFIPFDSMNKHVLLFLMIIFYIIPIYLVYNHYDSSESVSQIICDDNHKYIVFSCMVLMGFVTLLYEYNRYDFVSFWVIVMMLICIYGVIFIDESLLIHYIFAGSVFGLIYLFMSHHIIIKKWSIALYLSFFFAFILGYNILSSKPTEKKFLYCEIYYILNFAFFYLYLHFF